MGLGSLFQLPLLGNLQWGLGMGLALWLLNHIEILLAAYSRRSRRAAEAVEVT